MEAVTGSLKLSRRKFKRKAIEIRREILSLTWLYKKVSAAIHHEKKNQQNPRQAHQENLARQLYIWADNYFTNEKYGEALRCYHLSAEMGNAEAIFDIGIMYYEGTGVAQDYGEALKYFRKSAEGGFSDAQYMMGAMCYLGSAYYGAGIAESDYDEAVRWFTKSAEQGNAEAQNTLGAICENGDGVPKDLQKARRWYQKAARQGLTSAKEALKRLNAQ